MKILQNEDKSLNIVLTKQQQMGLVSMMIYSMIQTNQLVLNPETKEYEPTVALKQLLEEMGVL